jgi:hypothetical protein
VGGWVLKATTTAARAVEETKDPNRNERLLERRRGVFGALALGPTITHAQLNGIGGMAEVCISLKTTMLGLPKQRPRHELVSVL